MSVSVVRLSLISHARTTAMADGRFPGDEALDGAGERSLAGMTARPRADRVLSGPEIRARTTARIFAEDHVVEPAIADVDYGDWAGLAITDLPDATAAAWLTDSASVPAGGESLDTLFVRVEAWLESISTTPGRTLAVTSPAVIRAVVVLVLRAPIQSFWRIDVPPLTRTAVSYRGASWTVNGVAEKLP